MNAQGKISPAGFSCNAGEPVEVVAAGRLADIMHAGAVAATRRRGGCVAQDQAAPDAGRLWARTAIDVAIAAASAQLPEDGQVIRVHPIRHDRSRELGASANPKGCPRRQNSAIGNTG